MATSPGAYFIKNSHLAEASMGTRTDRHSTSAWDGGGTRASIEMKITVGTKKTRPAIKGIQFSIIPRSNNHLPTDFVTPSATIKLAHNPAISISLFFRPSRNPSTNPKIIPRDRPFSSKQKILHGGGINPKNNNINSATRIKALNSFIL